MYQKKILFISFLFLMIILTGCNKQTTAVEAVNNQEQTKKAVNQTNQTSIDFRELNVELPENKDIAKKYQASGSSLFINRVIDGNDNIEQDTNVWRLLSDEDKFKKYLEDKINTYLNI